MKLEKRLAQASKVPAKLNPLVHATLQREKQRRRLVKRLSKVHK